MYGGLCVGFLLLLLLIVFLLQFAPVKSEDPLKGKRFLANPSVGPDESARKRKGEIKNKIPRKE